MAKDFIELARSHNAIKYIEHNQFELLTETCASLSFNLFKKKVVVLFDHPKINPGGSCSALVQEWYRYELEGRDFFKTLQHVDDALLNRLNFLQGQIETYSSKRIDAALITNNSIDTKGSYSLNGLAVTKLNLNDSHRYEKIYGIRCDNVAVQVNFPINGISSYCAMFAKRKVDDRKISELEELSNVKSSLDFAKILDETISENTLKLGELKRIELSKYADHARYIGHAIGVLAKDNNGNKEFKLYDPNFGEATFSNVTDCKLFLADHLSENYDVIKQDYSSLFVTSFEDPCYLDQIEKKSQAARCH